MMFPDRLLDTDADALICELGVDAYAEARRKECEASSDTIARDWGQVAAAVAKRTGPDVLHRGRRDADVALGSEPVAPSEPRPNSEPSPLDRLIGSVFARPQQFRVQIVGAARGREPLLLKKVGADAADVSAAVVAAASLTLPVKTNGLHEGRLVFVRERTNPRLQSLSRQEPQVSLSRRRPWGLSQWRRALKAKHLSYVHNLQSRRREQAAQQDARWNKPGDKMSGPCSRRTGVNGL
jgi:hypothetical protein